jgi:hypothetical protein
MFHTELSIRSFRLLERSRDGRTGSTQYWDARPKIGTSLASRQHCSIWRGSCEDNVSRTIVRRSSRLLMSYLTICRAGAVSIYSHMMAYGGRDDGLFRGAILQSGGAFPLTRPDTTAFQSSFDLLITNTICSPYANSSAAMKLNCIRSLPLDAFRASVGSSTGQSIDGDFARTSIQRALPAGRYVRIATIVGCMSILHFSYAPRLTKHQRTQTKVQHRLQLGSTQQKILWIQSVSLTFSTLTT